MIAIVKIEDGLIVHADIPENVQVHLDEDCIVQREKCLDFGSVIRIVEEAEVKCECPHANENNNTNVALNKVVRSATLKDKSIAHENTIKARMNLEKCEKKVKDLKLDIRIVGLRYSFDCNTFFITFVSENRVDFRTMIRDLSEELNTHVHMIQIGVRDEATLIGGLAPCGQVMCCRRWMKQFDAVNVRMAKTQGLSLKLGAITGMCDRLKCCLRFENQQYKELGADLPRVGMFVETPSGIARIVERDVMGGNLKVYNRKTKGTFTYHVSDVRIAPNIRKAMEKGDET
ncbi:MAG: regulatory iron-sulfur-containing complex subunit RicT [Kiritimatiellae bacterium]|jgi:cell fate regulator YaaT (PSP1 superfamily)|nr:regulatory iron-sulfur-containing complex subunit RicT [Kiritimatiellia bacterium]